MTNTIRIIRSIVAAAIAVLGVLATSYPSWLWVPAALSFLGVIATHAVPALTEVSFLPPKTPTATKMSLSSQYGKGYTPTAPQDIYPYSTDPTTEGEPPHHA